MTRIIRIGTRASPLALWQTSKVQTALERLGHSTRIVEIHTTGDLLPDVPLDRIRSPSIFTRQLDDALLAGRIDLAVHSLKDIPTALPDGIEIVAVTEREDPRDALVGRPGAVARWADLPRGAVVATSSLRRRAQMVAARPDLRVVDVRGNVATRLAHLDGNPEWAATILAVAGLVRLGLGDRIGERLSADMMLPAPGQGALAVTARTADLMVRDATRDAVHDRATALSVTAERELLRRLEGGCQVPVAALAELVPAKVPELRLRGRVVSLDGRQVVDGERTGPAGNPESATAIGAELAEQLLKEGAGKILAAVRAAPYDSDE